MSLCWRRKINSLVRPGFPFSFGASTLSCALFCKYLRFDQASSILILVHILHLKFQNVSAGFDWLNMVLTITLSIIQGNCSHCVRFRASSFCVYTFICSLYWGVHCDLGNCLMVSTLFSVYYVLLDFGSPYCEPLTQAPSIGGTEGSGNQSHVNCSSAISLYTSTDMKNDKKKELFSQLCFISSLQVKVEYPPCLLVRPWKSHWKWRSWLSGWLGHMVAG